MKKQRKGNDQRRRLTARCLLVSVTAASWEAGRTVSCMQLPSRQRFRKQEARLWQTRRTSARQWKSLLQKN